MVPPNLIFWSISRNESLESQQKHAFRNRCSPTPSCSNDIFNPACNRKMLMRKRTSIPDGVCFNYKQLFHPENAPVVEYVNIAQEISSFCQKWLGFCELQINFIIFEVKTVSVTVHDKIQLVCISLEVHTYFSLIIIYRPL